MQDRPGKDSLVTVVIPVYGTEPFLEECVASVAAQSYENLQILLIDDGSPDNCPQICEKWAEKDRRIKVVHKKNEGLGMARNTGLELAEGAYICFLDSDDFLHPEAIAEARKWDADVVFYGFSDVDIRGNEIKKFVPKLPKWEYRGEEAREDFLPKLLEGGTMGLHPGVCWGMFSMEPVRQAQWRFPSEREIICEDIFALLELFRYVESVRVLPESYYFYRKKETSLSRGYREGRFEKAKDFYEKCRELCEKAGYSRAVKTACGEPFLGLAIEAMKWEKGEKLREIIGDPVLQRVVREVRAAGWQREALLWAVRHRLVWLCRGMLGAKKLGKM